MSQEKKKCMSDQGSNVQEKRKSMVSRMKVQEKRKSMGSLCDLQLHNQNRNCSGCH